MKIISILHEFNDSLRLSCANHSGFLLFMKRLKQKPTLHLQDQILHRHNKFEVPS